jgi:iron(III) transport system substrate-binding protein
MTNRHTLATSLGAALLIAGMLIAPANAQEIDPALQASWDYMQEAMPGVPYDVLAKACAEGEVDLYTGAWLDAQDAQIAAFNARFPCVKVRNFSSTIGALRERFLAESRAGRPLADIYQDTDVSKLDDFVTEGLVREYKISNSDSFEASDKHEGYWYPIRRTLTGIAWNTDLVSPEEASKLQEWKGVLDPVWKDRAIYVDPAVGGNTFAPLYLWQTLYGPDFIKQLGEQHPRIISGINNAAASLASGDVAVIFNANETGLLPLWEKGAPIQWSLPSPGLGPLTAQMLVKDGPHPNAAVLYHEYTFTAEGYSTWQAIGGAGARLGIDDKREIVSEPWYKLPSKMFPYDPKKASEAFPTILAEFNEFVGATK